jgi:hypothetical protein
MKARGTIAGVVVMAALAVSVVAIAASPALAATCGTQGQPLVLGCFDNTASSETGIYLAQDNAIGFAVHETGSGSSIVGVAGLVSTGSGIYGYSSVGNGVFGVGNGNGVWGHSFTGTGVYGDTEAAGAQNGVYGHANDSNGSGVYGQNDGTGFGVAGVSTNPSGGDGVLGDEQSPTGVGVEAESSGGGIALHVAGKAVFTRSGIVTVAAGKSSLVVPLSGVATSSMVLATCQQSASVYVKAAVPATGSFTIRLTGKAPAGGMKVAYFVLN